MAPVTEALPVTARVPVVVAPVTVALPVVVMLPVTVTGPDTVTAPVTSRPDGRRTRPVAASATSASAQAAPVADTLTVRSSLPASPISARPENPSWNSRLAV